MSKWNIIHLPDCNYYSVVFIDKGNRGNHVGFVSGMIADI